VHCNKNRQFTSNPNTHKQDFEIKAKQI